MDPPPFSPEQLAWLQARFSSPAVSTAAAATNPAITTVTATGSAAGGSGDLIH